MSSEEIKHLAHSGPAGVLRIVSYNVNGLRAITRKDMQGEKHSNTIKDNVLHHLLRTEMPDIVCLQEIKCSAKTFEWYPPPSSGLAHTYVCYSEAKAGYAGTMVCSRIKPLNVSYGLPGVRQGKTEGRVITLELADFFLVNVYVPNSGRKRERLEYRVNTWEPGMRAYLVKLQASKPVILIGDLNVIHEPIDMGLKTIVAGATPEEKKSFQMLLSETGMIDTFRHLHPHDRKYSWLLSGGPTGCRLDYCLVSASLQDKIATADILTKYANGSDHLPIACHLSM